jgi:hypothetical protein
LSANIDEIALNLAQSIIEKFADKQFHIMPFTMQKAQLQTTIIVSLSNCAKDFNWLRGWNEATEAAAQSAERLNGWGDLPTNPKLAVHIAKTIRNQLKD